MIIISCISPLIAFPNKFSDKGKMTYLPIKRDDSLGDWLHDKEILQEKAVLMKDGNFYSPIEIPCGKCIGCRLDQSREWALRCMMELQYHDVSSFITLTYNERSVPISYTSDPETGEAIPVMTLRKEDLTKFWKRLRKSLGEKKIRYFACGEYGKESWRPHYHAIVFGYRPDDLVICQNNQNGCYYQSDSLESIWHNYGNIIVAEVTFDSCAYVARYTAKKQIGTLDKDFFKRFNIEEPFLVMSRRPGVGWKYMEEHFNQFETDHIYVSGDQGCDGKIPRSFMSRLETIDPELFEKIKSQRRLRGNVYERALTMAHKVPYSKILSDAEENLIAKSKGILRNKA